MAPPVLLGYQRPEAVTELLDPWQQFACATSGLAIAILVFWLGYGTFTGALSGLGILAGTALVVAFFAVWGISWALTEHVACKRREQ